MGLIINSTQEKKIFINGTELEMPSVYARIEFAGRADGKKLEISVSTFASKTAYKNGASNITTDVQQGNLNVELLETEIQSVDVAHNYTKQAFENLGYSVEIDF